MVILEGTLLLLITVIGGLVLLYLVCALLYRIHGLIFNYKETVIAIREDGFWS